MAHTIWRQREGISVTYLQKALLDELIQLTGGIITKKIAVSSVRYFHRRVWNCLRKRKHIYISEDWQWVNITYEGKEFFARVEPIKHRHDGICPICGKHPLKVYTTGRKADHCEQCLKLKKRPQPKPHLCKCGRGMAKITRNGFIYSGCEQCQRENNRAWATKRQARLRERVANGDMPQCPHCGEPVYISASGMVYTYCTKHLNEIDRRRRKREKVRRFEEILKGKS